MGRNSNGSTFIEMGKKALSVLAVTSLLGSGVIAAAAFGVADSASGASSPAKKWTHHHRPHFIPAASLESSSFVGKGGKVSLSIPASKNGTVTHAVTPKSKLVNNAAPKLAATPKVVPTGATFTVNTTSVLKLATNGSETCTGTATGRCSLFSAVQAANNRGNQSTPTSVTIIVPAGTYQQTKTTTMWGDSFYLNNRAGTTIKGAAGGGTVIRGDGAHTVFGVGGESGTPGVFSNLTITNGLAGTDSFDGCGGGIASSGFTDVVELTHVTVTGNTAYRSGGGICSDGALYVSTSTVSANTVMTISHGQYLSGGGVTLGWDGEGAARFKNSTISHNTVTTSTDTSCNSTDTCTHDYTWFGAGGGIVAYDGSQLTLDNSSVSNNSLTSGTAKCAKATYIQYCGFLAGGGIFNEYSNVTVTSSSVDGNTANQTGQRANTGQFGSIGGGIANLGGLHISGSYVDSNVASTGPSGAANMNAAEGGGIDTYTPATITDSHVDGNSVTGTTEKTGTCAISGGAGIMALSAGFTLTGSNVTGNRVTNGAGGGLVIQSTGSTTTQPLTTTHSYLGSTLTNDVISGNSATSTTPYKTDTHAYDFGSGAGVILGHLFKNTSGCCGGTGDITAKGLSITNNHATSWAGGLWVNHVLVHMSDSTIANNTANLGGGTLLTYDALLSLDNSTIADNSSTGATFTVDPTTFEPGGGGIYETDFARVVLTYDTIAGNTAAVTGAGLAQEHGKSLCPCTDISYGTSVGTIIAGNTVGGIEKDCSTFTTQLRLTDGGWNLSGDNSCGYKNSSDQRTVSADLGALGWNGGAGQTMVPNVGSPAIDMGGGPACPSKDERGIARPQGPACDIGAAEAAAGYYEAGSTGGVFAFGGAPFYGSASTLGLSAPVVGMAVLPSANGYWLVTSNGKVIAFGAAPQQGTAAGLTLNNPIVGMTPMPSGVGYWLVASDGGIFAYGGAPFYGSTGGIHLNQPIVGITATPSGHGYWIVAADGGVFAFGDAAFYGSTGGIHLNKPVVGIIATASGHGYWLIASDGGIFAFGDAPFDGSMVGRTLTAPAIGGATAGGGSGYWVGAMDGGVFAFGAAPFDGSLPSMGVTVSNVTAFAAA